MIEKRLPLPVGTVLQGRYRIARQLGHGGFGAVYEAVDDELNLSFALKETFYAADEELRQAFRREARLLASLSHEAFPRVTHYFTEGEGCFLVMELVEGDDLDKLLGRRPEPFPEGQVLSWADQILDALEDLHQQGIIHRDIKPSNLKLTPRGKIKLLDFGIAKGALEGETEIMTTVGSMAAATLQYAPIEQVLKASPQYQMMLSVVASDKVSEIMRHGTDARSDLYALAATIYQLLTKQLPADAPTRALAVWSGQYDRLIPPHDVNPHVSRAVSDVLQKALKIDRLERLSTAAEMRRALTEAVNPYNQNQFPPPETVKVADNFIPPTMIQNPAPFTPQPLRQEMATEVTHWRETPKPLEKPKKSYGLYAVIIGIPLLILILGIIGIAVYYNLPSPNSNSGVSTANSRYEFMQTLVGHKSGVTSLSYSADSKLMASSESPAREVLIWDMTTNSQKRGVSFAGSAALSPDGKYLAYHDTTSGNSSLALFVVNGSTSTTIVKASEGDTFESIRISPDGNYVYYVQVKRTSTLSFDSPSITYLPYKIPILGGTPTEIKAGTKGAVFSPDLKMIAGFTDDNKLIVLDTAQSKIKYVFSGHTGKMESVAFSPDGKTIAGGGQTEINIWEMTSANAIQETLGWQLFFQLPAGTVNLAKRTLKGHDNTVTKIAFSPDGKQLVSGSEDKTIKIWDVASGNLLQTLTGHGGKITALAFSPDGKTLASGSDDKTIRLWRLKN